MTSFSEIRVQGLTKFDQLELQHELPSGVIRFEEERMPGGKHGELLTTAVIVSTVLGIRALGAWLLKTRTNNRIAKTVELVATDGSRRVEKIEIDLSKSTAPDRDVLGALAKLMGVDFADLLSES